LFIFLYIFFILWFTLKLITRFSHFVDCFVLKWQLDPHHEPDNDSNVEFIFEFLFIVLNLIYCCFLLIQLIMKSFELCLQLIRLYILQIYKINWKLLLVPWINGKFKRAEASARFCKNMYVGIIRVDEIIRITDVSDFFTLKKLK
jgi:hypothetical protein